VPQYQSKKGMIMLRTTVTLISLGLFLLPPLTTRANEETFGFDAKAETSDLSPNLWEGLKAGLLGRPMPLSGDLVITVTNGSTGAPLAGVSVLVGAKRGEPFTENLAVTGSDGKVSFTHETLNGPGPLPPVTAFRAGYGTASLLRAVGNSVSLQLQETTDENDFAFLRGNVQGFPQGLGSERLELGLFTPSLRPDSLLSFDPQQFVSSYNVKINIFGERDVPGNVVFPPQRKRYGLIPINLAKPDYIMPLPKGLVAHMTTIIGNVPISEAVSAIQDKDYLSVLNITNLTHVGWTSRRVSVRGDENIDLTASREINAGQLNARINGIAPNLDAVGVVLFDPRGEKNDFLALDIKASKRESIRNGVAQQRLGLLKEKRPSEDLYFFAGVFDRAVIEGGDGSNRSVVGALQPINERNPNLSVRGFLKAIRSLGVSGARREYRFSSASNGTLAPNLLILNLVSERPNSRTQGRTRNVLWSVVAQGNGDRISLPDLGRPVLPNPRPGEVFTWEITALLSSAVGDGTNFSLRSALKGLQHVSTLSQKF
jgi:hypothetical protein